jgi:hypothetical protein
MITPTGIFCVLGVVFVTCACVWSALLGERSACIASALGRRMTYWLGATTIALSIVFRMMERDWVHLFWSVQIPITSLLLCAGPFLDATRHDQEPVDETADRIGAKRSRWVFFAMLAVLGVLPLVLAIVLPEQRVIGRDVGRPFARLADLALWGFGGPLPESLAPLTDLEHARGVGHLPREVTVPMGTLFVAAWGWIVFVLLAVIGRFVPTSRGRRVFLLVAPTMLAFAACFAHGSTTSGSGTCGLLDVSYFRPLGALDSGIWTSEPVVLRSFGPVLSTAAACVLLLQLVTASRRPKRADLPVIQDVQRVRPATT